MITQLPAEPTSILFIEGCAPPSVIAEVNPFAPSAPHVWVFCSYAFEEWPLGARFTLRGEMLTLAAVTQQWFRRFEVIPRGWKTICAFVGTPTALSQLSALPVIAAWGAGRSPFTELIGQGQD